MLPFVHRVFVRHKPILGADCHSAPFAFLLIFCSVVGGNHEASNYLWELYHGGWVAPNIYFLGHAGVVNFGGLRIAGLSGIYKSQHYDWGHHEAVPYTEASMRSVYHIRSLDVNRLLRLTGNVDVFLSHDWPAGIAAHGNLHELLRRKPFLKEEIEAGSLGSPPGAQLLQALRPSYWFAAHLHTKFAALVLHGDGSTTRFLSLDKCLPGRQFLQVVDFESIHGVGPFQLRYDAEWLAILQATHSLTSLHQRPPPPPPPEPVSRACVEAVENNLASRGLQNIPHNFQQTAPAHQPDEGFVKRRGRMPRSELRNLQTQALLGVLGLTYDLDHGTISVVTKHEGRSVNAGVRQNAGMYGPQEPLPEMVNPEEIDLPDDNITDM
jgi:lariat debranching enzyme